MLKILHYGFAPVGHTAFDVPLSSRLLDVCEVDGGMRAYFLCNTGTTKTRRIATYVALTNEPVPCEVVELYTFAGLVVTHRAATTTPDFEHRALQQHVHRLVLHVFVLGAEEPNDVSKSPTSHALVAAHRSARRRRPDFDR